MADYGDEHAREARRASVPPHPLGVGRRRRDMDEEARTTEARGMSDDKPKEGRRPVVAVMLDYQQAELYKLSELVAMLGDIITPAMLPENPNGEGMAAEDGPEMSELARSIDNNTDIVRTLQRRVKSYMDRLEV